MRDRIESSVVRSSSDRAVSHVKLPERNRTISVRGLYSVFSGRRDIEPLIEHIPWIIFRLQFLQPWRAGVIHHLVRLVSVCEIDIPVIPVSLYAYILSRLDYRQAFSLRPVVREPIRRSPQIPHFGTKGLGLSVQAGIGVPRYHGAIEADVAVGEAGR